ncbi:MAG: GNAT family N-acetyltransferase [Lewinellaceae bacterium]|nr:GNAT family N-acetyltransferase [Lewinellaceae bacterium]
MSIKPLTAESLAEFTRLALELWPECAYEEEYRNAEKLLGSPKDAVFLCRTPGGNYIAFIMLSLRHDYVEGTDSTPVGYIEGIYVRPGHRKGGIARQLVRIGEAWCREQGCREMASDAEIGNAGSQAFHERMGFEEANRVVCYRKELG